jgi:hypothetical protein
MEKGSREWRVEKLKNINKYYSLVNKAQKYDREVIRNWDNPSKAAKSLNKKKLYVNEAVRLKNEFGF